VKIRYWSYKSDYNKKKIKYFKQLKKVLNSGQLILGSEVKKIEKNIAKYLNCKYALGVNSGTDALLISLMSLDVKKNDEIITTSNTAIPTISAIVSSGAKPVFVDIKEIDFLINEDEIEKKITKNTRAIIVVHLYGQAPNMKKINLIAKKNNIRIIEDCAQSFGSTYYRKKLGSFGNISAISFYPTKILGAFGDGGMIVTNNKKLYTKIKKLRFYGITNDYKSDIHGINSRLDELQAGILNLKFQTIDKKIELRRKIAKYYSNNITNENIILPKETKGNKHVYYSYVIRTKYRKKFINFLKKNNIETKIIYPHPIHRMKPYSKYSKKKLILTDKISKEIVSIPIYPELNINEQNRIIKTINKFNIDEIYN